MVDPHIYPCAVTTEIAEAKFKEVMKSYEAIKLERKNGINC